MASINRCLGITQYSYVCPIHVAYTPVKTCSSWLMHDDFLYSYNVCTVGEVMVFCALISLYIICISNSLSGANNVLKLLTDLPS